MKRDQAIEGDRELANANPGRVPHRVGDGAGGAGDPDLADALDAERVDVRIVLLDENRFERAARRRSPAHGTRRDWRSSSGRSAGP